MITTTTMRTVLNDNDDDDYDRDNDNDTDDDESDDDDDDDYDNDDDEAHDGEIMKSFTRMIRFTTITAFRR